MIYEVERNINDVVADIDSTLDGLVTDRLRQSKAQRKHIWDYESEGWVYVLSTHLTVMWLRGGEPEFFRHSDRIGDVRWAKITARRINIETAEKELATDCDIRFDFEFISNRNTKITVTRPDGRWNEVLESITSGWERIDESPAAAELSDDGLSAVDRNRIEYIKQQINSGKTQQLFCDKNPCAECSKSGDEYAKQGPPIDTFKNWKRKYKKHL